MPRRYGQGTRRTTYRASRNARARYANRPGRPNPPPAMGRRPELAHREPAADEALRRRVRFVTLQRGVTGREQRQRRAARGLFRGFARRLWG